MLTKEQKDDISKEFGKSEGDTGSTEVQIALLSARIIYLTEHLKQQPKDYSSRRGLLKLVGQRRNFLNYLKSRNMSSYDTITPNVLPFAARHPDEVAPQSLSARTGFVGSVESPAWLEASAFLAIPRHLHIPSSTALPQNSRQSGCQNERAQTTVSGLDDVRETMPIPLKEIHGNR